MKKYIGLLIVLFYLGSSTKAKAQVSWNDSMIYVKLLDLDLQKKIKALISEVVINHEEQDAAIGPGTIHSMVITKHDIYLNFNVKNMPQSDKEHFKPGTHIGRIKLNKSGMKSVVLKNAEVLTSKIKGKTMSVKLSYN